MTEVKTQADQTVLPTLTQAEILGKKLAFYISALVVPEDVRQTLARLIPTMSFTEAADFMSILEAAYLDQETKEIDADFKEDTQEVVVEHAQQSIKLDDEIMGRLRDLMRNAKTV